MKSDKTNIITNKESKRTITRNYNGESLKPGEVLVPTMYDEAFAKANCTNPECIKTITLAGRKFKVLYIAVPETVSKAAHNSFNLAVNEQLGHYAVPNSVSLNQTARAAKQETGELFSDLIHHLIDRSPKHGLAALLLLNGSKGVKFQEKMHLGHDAANTVRKQSADLLKVGLANIDLDEIKSKKSKHTDYYREEAYRLLDALLKLYNA